MTSRILTGILFLGSVALALTLGEALARSTSSWWRVDVAATDASGESLYAHHPLYGWTKRRSTRAAVRTREYDAVVETDSLGLRGPETTRAKPTGTKRVLMLGDSYLEGYSVAYDDLVSTRLERLLEESGSNVEVLNAGTAGYATDQELLYFAEDGRTFEPDLTVLLFYLNDVYYNARTSYWRGPKPWFELSDTGLVLRGVPVPEPDESGGSTPVVREGPTFARLLRQADSRLFPSSALYRLGREVIENSPTISGLAIRLGAFEVPAEYGPWRRTYDPHTAYAWHITEALIERLRDEVGGAGSDLLVFYVPSIAAITERDWRRARRAHGLNDEEWSPSADAEALVDICRRLEVDCLNPLAAFRAEAAALAADSGEPLYFPVDRHWTPAGHDLAAREIARHVRGRL